MGKQRRKKGNYAERKNKDGSVSRFSIPTISGKPKWVKIPHLAEYEGKRGARRHLEWCRTEYGGDWTTDTLEQGANKFLAHIASGKASTIKAHRTAINTHLLPRFGRQRILEIRRGDIQQLILDYVPSRASAGYMKTGILYTLRAILNQYTADEQLPRNPATGVFRYPPAREAPSVVSSNVKMRQTVDGRQTLEHGRALSINEVELLLNHMPESHWTMALTMLWTGLRMGEARAMQWQYLDIERGRYQVAHTADINNDLVSPKTRQSANEVAISPMLMQALTQHRSKVAAARLAFGEEWTENDLVFPSMVQHMTKRYGQVQTSKTLARRLRLASSRAEIGLVRPHDLRHTCASLLIAKGENIKVVSAQLRHAKVSTTLDVYGHLYPQSLSDAASGMDELMDAQQLAQNG